MKTVAAGAHYTTVTVDTAEAVKFSFPSTSLSVEASGGDITVALRQGAQAGDDETITVPNGESRMFIHHRMNVDTYYLTGSGTAKLYASNMGDVNPFNAGKRGGDSGGTLGLEEVVLWENDGTTNPDTITLSEAWSNFDEIEVVTFKNDDATLAAVYCLQYNTKEIITGKRIFAAYLDSSVFVAYVVNNDTTLALNNHKGVYYVTKIIGRRYTKVSPTGYREIELYSNDEHVATPINTVIPLSQNWADFDAIGFISEYNNEVGLCAYNEWKVSVISAANKIALNFDAGSSQNSFIFLRKNASNSFVVDSVTTTLAAQSHVYKVIGIKY